MSLSEMVEKASQSFFTWAVVTVGGGVLWLIRRVFTNQKQIEMMVREFEVRDDQRKEDRRDLHEVKQDVRQIRDALLKELER